MTDWVQVPYNEARYGANYCGDIVCATTWLFVRDEAAAWYNSQVAAGKTPAEIDAYLSQFDVWDRYDYDGDGNFNEPDGYIDHFQAIHAGEGEETGGGAQGTDAIWSHRWYAFYNNIGFTGPGFNPLGGVQVGGSSYWIGDYTVEPENGGVGVFAHEFGHDLGLPDLYDTSGKYRRRRELNRLLDAVLERFLWLYRQACRWNWQQADPYECLREAVPWLVELSGSQL